MGLVRGLVLAFDRRTALAILAIAVAVGYALVAGAAVGGLESAQDVLAEDLEQTRTLITRPDGASFEPSALPSGLVLNASLAIERLAPDALAQDLGDQAPGPARSAWTVFTVREGPSTPTNASHILATPASGLADGQRVTIAGTELLVEHGRLPAGASDAWLALSQATFAQVTERLDTRVDVTVLQHATPGQQDALRANGFTVSEGPAAVPFYTAGADQLVSGLAITVGSATLVVALLTSGLVVMDLRARRRSFATLQAYAGTRLVRRLVTARGVILLLAGHLLALAGLVALLTLAGQVGGLGVSTSWTILALTMGATGLGGLGGVALASRGVRERVQASQLRERTPPSWLPRWLRFSTTSWRVLGPLLAAAVVLSASLGTVYGIVDLPGQLFGATGEDVLASTSGNPLRGTVDAFPAYHLPKLEAYHGASPEIFAPTILAGEPVMARGVDWDRLGTVEDVALVAGRPPADPSEAVAGQRLADRLDLRTGQTLTLPAPYRPAVTHVTLVGVARAQGLVGDELLLHLDTARELAGVGPGQVNIVRLNIVPGSSVDVGATPKLPNEIIIPSIQLEPERPVPFQTARVQVDLVNFAPDARTRQLTLQVNGEPVADAWAELDGRSTDTVDMTFRVPREGIERLEVNPELNPSTGEPAYRLQAPNAASVNRSLTVQVHDRSDEPAQGVRVILDGDAATTDASGQATLTPSQIGNRTLLAEGPEGRSARPLVVVQPGDLHRPRLRLLDIAGPSRVLDRTWEGVIRVENVGGEAFSGPVRIQVDGEQRNTTNTTLLSGRTQRLEVTLSLTPGEHTLGSNRVNLAVTTQPQSQTGGGQGPGPGATLEELLEQRRSQTRTRDSVDRTATQAFLGDTFSNFNTALTVVTLATVLLAGLVVLVAVQREIEQRANTLGTLRAVGAGTGDLRRIGAREFVLVGALAASLGTALGLGLAATGAQLGLLTGFGHALVPRTSLGFGFRLAITLLALTLGAALLAIDRTGTRAPQELLASGPRRSARAPLDKLIGGQD